MIGINCLNIECDLVTTIGGITFKWNNNGSITCNGTNATEDTIFLYVGYLTARTGNFILSGCPVNGSDETYRLDVKSSSSGTGVVAIDYGESVQFNMNYCTRYCFIRIAPGYTCNNLVFWPMIKPSYIAGSTYNQYSMQLQNLSYKVLGLMQDKSIINTKNRDETPGSSGLFMHNLSTMGNSGKKRLLTIIPQYYYSYINGIVMFVGCIVGFVGTGKAETGAKYHSFYVDAIYNPHGTVISNYIYLTEDGYIQIKCNQYSTVSVLYSLSSKVSLIEELVD